MYIILYNGQGFNDMGRDVLHSHRLHILLRESSLSLLLVWNMWPGHSHIIPQASAARDMVSPHCRTLPNVISYSTTLSNLAVANGVDDDGATVVAKTHWQRGIALCAGCKQERLHANEAPLGFGGGGNQKSHTRSVGAANFDSLQNVAK